MSSTALRWFLPTVLFTACGDDAESFDTSRRWGELTEAERAEACELVGQGGFGRGEEYTCVDDSSTAFEDGYEPPTVAQCTAVALPATCPLTVRRVLDCRDALLRGDICAALEGGGACDFFPGNDEQLCGDEVVSGRDTTPFPEGGVPVP